MATFNTINIYELNQIEEVIPGNYLIVQNENGTNIIDFKNFVVGPDNVSWYTTFTSTCAQLTTTVNSLCNTTTFYVNDLNSKTSFLSSSYTTLNNAITQGSYTNLLSYTAPNVIATATIPLSVKACKVTIVGGGGAGGGTTTATAGIAGGGGSSGSTVIRYFTGVGGQTFTYRVGAGGVGAASNGVIGADTVFILNNITLSARGGSGGTAGAAINVNYAGGTPFTTSFGGDLILQGDSGRPGSYSATVALALGGFGGNGLFGMGAGRGNVGGGAGSNGTSPGAGGGGAVATGANQNGGNGADGIVIVEY